MREKINTETELKWYCSILRRLFYISRYLYYKYKGVSIYAYFWFYLLYRDVDNLCSCSILLLFTCVLAILPTLNFFSSKFFFLVLFLPKHLTLCLLFCWLYYIVKDKFKSRRKNILWCFKKVEVVLCVYFYLYCTNAYFSEVYSSLFFVGKNKTFLIDILNFTVKYSFMWSIRVFFRFVSFNLHQKLFNEIVKNKEIGRDSKI